MSLAEKQKQASPLLIFVAFATVYIVWGSTYFFIAKAVAHIPPFMLGALRFIIAGVLLLLWCVIRKEKIFNPTQIKHASITGVLLLFVGTGAVIWVEKTMPSSLVGVLIASQALWFVLLDKPNWKTNLSNRNTVAGLLIGFGGVILLMYESAADVIAGHGAVSGLSLLILLIGMWSWAGGSLYSKKKSTGSTTVNSAWQMLAAGLVFLPASLLNKEWAGFDWQAVPASSWLATAYLVVFGSLAAFSAYVWLLSVRPVTQVSTHVYVNPVVAVLLGVLFAGEHMSGLQLAGLAVILASVLLINLAKYRKTPDNNNHTQAPASKSSMPLTGTAGKIACAK
ncbi:EamA family transporter [Paraflavitalea pollutisoli]|uniref:EamA family transporter n=1 Tax=Paraflavitalea pollutisoli TaxID=3034143 RepID=UPI0023EB890D|nr:EamA family transporter [Paraflavitalea sp. H1-2-19X]